MATTAMSPSPDAPIEALPFLTPKRLRVFSIVGGVVLAIGLITWFLITAGRRKEAYAARALEEARAVAESGNIGEAVQQFSKVATTYKGTAAAYQATLGMAQARLVAGQDQLAVTTLTDFLKASPPAAFASPGNGLLGTAYENLGRFPDAITAYRKAADLADVDYLKAQALLDAARASRLAGKKDEAIALYREILSKYAQTPSKTEAQVRLAELTGGAM